MSSVPVKHKPNTKVTTTPQGYDVTLHGHLIVSIQHDLVVLNTCGYSTRVTKRRMNQVLEEEGISVRVYSKKGQWYCGSIPFMPPLNTHYYGIKNPYLYCVINKANI